MSVTMSPPIRVVAFLCALVAAGIAAFLFLVVRPGSGADTVGSPTPVTNPAPGTKPADSKPRTTVAPRPATRPATVQTPSGFPVPVHRALRRHRVVVVAVYMPGAGVDLQVRAAARAGARQGGAGFVAVSALSERLVRPLVAKTGVLPDPAVVVIKRPGIVSATLSVADRETIAQAVVQAKR
jgi:hypothetical protein